MSDELDKDELVKGLKAVGLNVLTEDDIPVAGVPDKQEELKGEGDGKVVDIAAAAKKKKMDAIISDFEKRGPTTQPPKGRVKDHIANVKKEIRDRKRKEAQVTADIPIVNVAPKLGNRVGVCGAFKGQMVMSNVKYKVIRIKPNGNLVLKALGAMKEGEGL